MISRRTFASRAALFVLGCALQVSGVASLLKRGVVSRLADIQAGMVFNPACSGTAAGRAEIWQVVEVSDYGERTKKLLCVFKDRPERLLVETYPWYRAKEIEDYAERDAIEREQPRVITLSGHRLGEWHFHFPV